MKADVSIDVTVCLKSFLSRVGSKRGFFIAGKKEKKCNRLITNMFFCYLMKNKERNRKRKVSNDLRGRFGVGTGLWLYPEDNVAGGVEKVCGVV